LNKKKDFFLLGISRLEKEKRETHGKRGEEREKTLVNAGGR